MALRLVNNAPGVVSGPVNPAQKLQFGFKSETLSVDISSIDIHAGFSNVKNHGVLPESDETLEELGASVVLETSERRRPETATIGTSFSGDSLILTKTSNLASESCVYEVTVPITQGASTLAHFVLRKKNAWSQTNPDWCNLTNMTGVYLGIEHGTFNTAAYAMLRNDGATGSIVFGGPLQAYNLARPGQVELAQTSIAGGAGWMSLADDEVLNIFIRMNTYVSPFRAELWTMTTGQAPVLQGTIPIASLDTFPATTFTNSRSGVSDTATLFFGNIGQAGDILRLDDWAIYPDYATLIKSGQSLTSSTRDVVADALIQYDVADAVLPSESDPSRWFDVSGVGYQDPNPELHYQPGYRLRPQYLSMTKTDPEKMLMERQEPRLEQVDGSMVEAVIYGSNTVLMGDLVGLGFVLEDGVNSFKVVALENDSERNFGIASSDAQITSAAYYYRSESEIDYRSPKFVRLISDRVRGRVMLEVDEETVVDRELDGPASLVSGPQAATTALIGTSISIDISTDGGTSSVTRSHAFVSDHLSISSLVADMNADAVFIGAGDTEIEVIDRGTTFAIRSITTGELVVLTVNPASTAIVAGGLELESGQTSTGQTTDLPAAPDSTGRVQFGFPFYGTYQSELRLRALNYMPRYSAWDTSDSLLPDSSILPSGALFTLNDNGTNECSISSDSLSILKTDFASSATHRYYRRNESFSDQGAVLVDFKAHVSTFTNSDGQVNASGTAIGAGICVYLGTRRVHLSFYDCGMLGKRIGITPGSGSDEDILTQTELGRSFSAMVDWTIPNNYRLLIRPFKDIRVWSGTFLSDPVITIPWQNDTDGFDIPVDVSATGLAFGHFNYMSDPSASTTVWEHVRWGFSNGYDMSTSKVYPNGIPSYAFGGSSFILSEFDES